MTAQGQLVATCDGAGNPLGGTQNFVIPSGAATFTVKSRPGRLCRVSVTAVGTGTVTFYDNATTGSGTVLYTLPASLAIGSYDVSMPAVNGITAVATASGPAVTVLYS